MKINKTFVRWAIPGTIACMTIVALTAWTGGPQQPGTTGDHRTDTVPPKERTRITREPGDKDLDKEMRQLEAAKESLKEVNWEQIQENVEAAMKNIDADKIRRQVEQSLKQVDMEKIQREVQESLQKIDFDKIQKEVSECVKKLDKEDMEKIKKEIEEAKREVEKELKSEKWKKEIEESKKESMEEVEKAMAEAKKEMARAKVDIDKEKLNFKEEMKKAHIDIDKAKEELKGYQDMIYTMEANGLLSTKEDYTIEWKKGELTVNGKKQPVVVADKYRKYFTKDTVTVKKENGNMKINPRDNDFD